MPFFAPKSLPCEALHVRGEWYRALQERGEGFDYLFPRVQRPRGAAVDDGLDGRVRFLPGPASSSYVIKLLRLLLTLPPLSLTPQQAAEFSGHSLRHCLPCLARALALPMEDRDELGRWVAGIDSRGPGTGPRAGRTESLSN